MFEILLVFYGKNQIHVVQKHRMKIWLRSLHFNILQHRLILYLNWFLTLSSFAFVNVGYKIKSFEKNNFKTGVGMTIPRRLLDIPGDYYSRNIKYYRYSI